MGLKLTYIVKINCPTCSLFRKNITKSQQSGVGPSWVSKRLAGPFRAPLMPLYFPSWVPPGHLIAFLGLSLVSLVLTCSSLWTSYPCSFCPLGPSWVSQRLPGSLRAPLMALLAASLTCLEWIPGCASSCHVPGLGVVPVLGHSLTGPVAWRLLVMLVSGLLAADRCCSVSGGTWPIGFSLAGPRSFLFVGVFGL